MNTSTDPDVWSTSRRIQNRLTALKKEHEELLAERDRAVKHLRQSGVPVALIAQHFGIAESSVYRVARNNDDG